jgi:uncharacterized protein
MKKRPLLAYFIFVFIWVWGLAAIYFLFQTQLTALFGKMSGSNPFFILVVWGPNVAALTISAVNGGWKAVSGLLSRFIIWRVGLRWYLFVLLGLPAIGLLAALLAGTFSFEIFTHTATFMALLFNLLITGPVGEELGWRGFALPRLLQRYNPLTASLILGCLWGFWHLPSFLASGTPQTGLSFPAFVLGAVVLTIITTWVFIHTRGSVLMSALIHFMANFSLTALGAPLSTFSFLLLVVCAIVIILGRQQWITRSRISTQSQAE